MTSVPISGGMVVVSNLVVSVPIVAVSSVVVVVTYVPCSGGIVVVSIRVVSVPTVVVVVVVVVVVGELSLVVSVPIVVVVVEVVVVVVGISVPTIQVVCAGPVVVTAGLIASPAVLAFSSATAYAEPVAPNEALRVTVAKRAVISFVNFFIAPYLRCLSK